MITFSIQSGSNGNCIYVEAGDTRLLFDAGVSGKRAKERMAEHGRCPTDVDALFISHEHGDHIRSAGVFHRMFNVPVYVTKPTLNANGWSLGRLDDVRHFRAGESICIDGVTVHTIPTPHDAVDTVSFIVEHDGRRLGIFTDLGHAVLHDPRGYPCVEYQPWKLEYVPPTDGRSVACRRLYDRLEQESDRLFEVARKKRNKISKPRRERDGQKA